MAIDFEKIRKDNNFKKTVNLKITKPVETKKDIPSQVGLSNLADVTKLTKLTAPKTTTQPTTTTVDTEQMKANALSDFNLVKKIENIETQYNKATNPTLKKSLKQALYTLKANQLSRTQPSKVQEQKSQGIVTGAKDITNILGTGGASIVKGAAGAVERLTTMQDQVGQGVVNILNQITNQNKKVTTILPKITEESAKIGEKAGGIIETAKKTSSGSGLSNVGMEYAEVIGNLAPSILLGMVSPGLGTAELFFSASNSYSKDAKQRGLTGLKGEAYADLMGAAEAISVRFGLGKLGSALKNIAKKQLVKGAIDVGTGATINAVQEAVMEPLTEVTSQALGGKHDYKDIGKRMLDSGIDGAMVFLIMGGMGSGFVKSTEIGDKLAEGKPISEEEVKEAVAEMDKAGVDTTKIKNSYNDKVKELVENKDKIIEAENKKEEQVVDGLKEITKRNKIVLKKKFEPTKTKQEEKVENIPVKEKVEEIEVKETKTTETQNKIKELEQQLKDEEYKTIQRDVLIDKNTGKYITRTGELTDKLTSEVYNIETKKLSDIELNKTDSNSIWAKEHPEINAKVKQIDVNVKNDSSKIKNIEEQLKAYKQGYESIEAYRKATEQGKEKEANEIINTIQNKGYLQNNIKTKLYSEENGLQSNVTNVIKEIGKLLKEEYNGKVYYKSTIGNEYITIDGKKYRIVNETLFKKEQKPFDKELVINRAKALDLLQLDKNELKKQLQEYLDIKPTEIKPTEKLAKEEVTKKKQKQLSEIAKMEKEEAGIVPTAKYKKETSTKPQAKERGFYKNVAKSNFISEEVKSQIESSKYDIKTNQESLDEAYQRLEKKGVEESNRWLSLDLEKDAVNETDIAEGYILYENAIQNNQLDTAFMIIDKLGAMVTKTARTLQIFSLLGRLTPAGMIKYVQKSLDKAFDVYSEKKTKEWIDNNREKFKLTEEDADFISRNMKAITEITDKTEKGIRQKQILLGEISKIASDKLPPEKGQSVKAYLRIAMLFNPKTQTRNILGNVGLVPITFISDTIASKLDKHLAKTSKIRTTTPPNIKVYAKGFKKGISLTIDDFKRGINTNVMGNRYEIVYDNQLIQSKSFNENTKSKTLNSFNNKMNSIDRYLSTALTLGDRPFYEAAFLNSIEGQMKANNVNVPTSTMIDIATNEALERTWQDNNEFTKAVLDLRININKLLGVRGFGSGDVLIPFAKTPANLTRAIVKYNPVNAVSIAKSYDKYKKALSTGEDIAKAQKKLVDDFGKTLTGTLLYLIGYALAQLGFTSGDTDKNKSVTQFEKNVMGKQPYSIKVGDTTITYDWIIPGAVPFGIMAELSKKEVGIAEKIRQAFVIAGDTVVNQSFLASINKVISDYDGFVNGLINAGYDLPARFIPTILKQAADVFDDTVRTSYVYDNQLQTMANKLKVKIPGLSQTVEPLVNVMGEEVKRSDNIAERIFTAFLSPAMVGKSTASKEAEEIYSVYQEVGDNAMIPKVSPNYITYKKEKVTLTPKEKTEWQKTSGEYMQKEMAKLIKRSTYNNASDEAKSKMIKNLVEASYDVAKLKFLKGKE